MKHTTVILGDGDHGNDLDLLALLRMGVANEKVFTVAACTRGALRRTNAKEHIAILPLKTSDHLGNAAVGPKDKKTAAADAVVIVPYTLRYKQLRCREKRGRNQSCVQEELGIYPLECSLH